MRTFISLVVIGSAVAAVLGTAQVPPNEIVGVSGAPTVRLLPDGASLAISITTHAPAAGAAAGQTPVWREFRSRPTGIIGRYPANWVRFGTSPDQLQLRSSPGGREGVIIKPGQAMLTLLEPKDAPARTFDGVVEYFTQGADSITTRRDLPSDGAQGGCQELKEVVSWEPIVPREGAGVRPPEMVNTEYFCKVGSRIVVTVVRNYADDPRTAEYRAVGLQVARSIRIVPLSRPSH